MIQNLLHLFKKDSEKVPNEDELIADVDKKVKAAESRLQAQHRQWFVNIAMRRGLQYVQTEGNQAIVPARTSDREVRMVINKLNGIHQTRLAKIVTDLPLLECIPGSSEEEDKALARKGTKLLSWVWVNEHMPEKMTDLGSWMIDCSDSFLYVYWDHTAGPEVPIFKRHEGKVTGEEGYNVDAEGYVLDSENKRIEERVTLGEVKIAVLPSFDVINDGISQTIDDSHWLIIQQAMSLKDIVTQWPERGKLVKAEKDLATRAYYQSRLMAMSGNESEYFAPESKSPEEMATVRTYLERKSEEYPKGRRIVCAGGVLLEAGAMPYDHGLYPLVKFTDIFVSGSFWGMSTTEIAIPIQKGYNKLWSQVIENANNHGNIKLLADNNHGMQADAYDDSGDEVIEHTPGTVITQLQPATLPGHIMNMFQWYDRAFEDVTGQHEVSNGQAPAGVKSGRAILALQEQDDTRLAPTKLKFLRGIERVGSMVIQLYQQFQDEDRTREIIGTTSTDIDEFTITKDEIQSMNKDVRVQSENLIAAQKSIQQDQVLDYWDRGLFGPKENPTVRQKVLKILEFGDVSELFDELSQDSAQAKRENDAFLTKVGLITITDPVTGKQIQSLPAFEFEDQPTHIRIHNQFRRSQRYRNMTPEERRPIDLHVKIHENLDQKNAAPQQEGPAPIPGPAPSGPQQGTPSGPPLKAPPVGAPPMPQPAPPPPETA